MGGNRATADAWPATVALVRPDRGVVTDTLRERQFCGGTVIAPRWVLTAAHCVTMGGTAVDADSLLIVAGITDLAGGSESDEYTVVSIIAHESYHPERGVYDDIALLEIANELPVPATSLFNGDASALEGMSATVVGWGAMESRDPDNLKFDSNLREGEVPIVPLGTCNGPQSYQGRVRAGQICAGFEDGQVNHCFGDSGGPLYRRNNGVPQLVGLVTVGGAVCESPYLYGVYSDISFYRSWVARYVELTNLPDQQPTEDDEPATPAVGNGGGGAAGIMALLAGLALAWRGGKGLNALRSNTEAWSLPQTGQIGQTASCEAMR